MWSTRSGSQAIIPTFRPLIRPNQSPQPLLIITINNLTATGASAAGYIVGVPEKPFTAITLNAVKITAKTGLEVRNAAVVVTGGTTMKVSSGSAYIIQSGGSVTTK